MKTMIINFFLLLSMLGALLLSPPLIYFIYSIFFDPEKSSYRDESLAELKLYENHSWAQTHFREMNQLETRYMDYITWRREDFKGKTITIKDGRRINPSRKPVGSDEHFWFFGGSTTWGTGVNDANTFPAIFSDKTSSVSVNFGESGYIARQSLALLNNMYISKDANSRVRKTIIFYDGVNEVLSGCRVEVEGQATNRQWQLQNLIKAASREYKWGISRTFAQVNDFVFALTNTLLKDDRSESASFFSCHESEQRAHEVASNLVATWSNASKLARAHGDEFYALLQPVAFLGKPQLEHLSLDDQYSKQLSKQYHAVYPKIKERLRAIDFNAFDLSGIMDTDQELYIDMCHVAPLGNRIVADKIFQIIQFQSKRRSTPVNIAS